MAMTVGSLFAGIGGFDLGLTRAGFEVRWQVEIDPFCRAVLAQHWPDVRRYDDVRTVGHTLEPVDVVCGGFPCQDISSAGTKVGIGGARSGLWSEFRRVLGAVRPRYVLVENVAMLAARHGGLGVVLGDLAALGYDTDWDCLPIALFGAPHLRPRLFVVGYPHGHGEPGLPIDDETRGVPPVVANAERAWREERGALGRAWGARQSLPWDSTGQCVDSALAVRVDDGLSHRMDRLGALGNSVSPVVAEWLGRRILTAAA